MGEGNDGAFFEESRPGYSENKDFTTLCAWKKARQLRRSIYGKGIPRLPAEEKYALNPQMSKAAVNGTNNIAEGYGTIPLQGSYPFLLNRKRTHLRIEGRSDHVFG